MILVFSYILVLTCLHNFPKQTYTLKSRASSAKNTTAPQCKTKTDFLSTKKRKKNDRRELEYKRTLIDARTDGMTEFMMHAAGFSVDRRPLFSCMQKQKQKKKKKRKPKWQNDASMYTI